MLSLTRWVYLFARGDNCAFCRWGKVSEILGLNDPVGIFNIFRLACAKGQLVTIAHNRPILTHWVIQSPGFPRIPWVQFTRWVIQSLDP